MNYTKLNEILTSEPSFRRKQVEEALFSLLITNWNEASNLPKSLREKLETELPFEQNIKRIEEQKNAVKTVFDFEGDLVESVLMRHKDRNTVCVSSQAGCPLACLFCFTGQNGFQRNLNKNEIIEQVLFFQRYLKKIGDKVTNIVFMGMGEPFLNYEAVLSAIKDIHVKFNIGARRISVSTVGLVPEIKRFAKDAPQTNLALSLHATNDALRNELMPINKKYSIKEVLKAVKAHQIATNRRVMIEYMMLEGINDSVDDANQLSELLKSNILPIFMVNLIRYNDTGKYKSSKPERIKKFKNILLRNNIEVVERYRFGETIHAACGQLAGVKL